MQIVVTGGAGFIGANAALYFAARGHDVTVVDNLSRFSLLAGEPARDAQNVPLLRDNPRIQVVEKDLRDQHQLASYLKDADVILHAAGQTGVVSAIKNPVADFQNNLVATINLLEAARQSPKDPTLLFCSTNKVYGTNINDLEVVETPSRYELARVADAVDERASIDQCAHTPYGCSKLAADLYVQDYFHTYGLKSAVFRMSCIYGPHQLSHEYQGWVTHICAQFLRDQPIHIYGTGKQVRDVLHIDDLVRAYEAFIQKARALQHEVFNIGGGPDNAISLLQLIRLLEQYLQKRVQVEFHPWRSGDQRIYLSDISKIQRVLAWSPRITPEEGLERLLDHLRGQT